MKGVHDMFFADFTPKYYLLAADYTQHPELTLKEKTRLVIDEYKEEIINYCDKEMIMPPVTAGNDNYYVILWRNLPKTNIADNNEDTLINQMCQSIDLFENELFDVYIKDLNTLANGSIENFIRRLCLIKKHTNKKPTFLDNTTSTLLTPKFVSDSKEDMETLAKQTYLSIIEYDNMIGFLENLYSSVIGNNVDDAEYGFIHYYFEWQKGNIPVKDVLVALGNMSKRTFYQYVVEFEVHPYYPEFCKLHFSSLINTEKKGPASIDWQEYYDSVGTLFVNKKINIDTLSGINTDNLCTKYNLVSTLDVYRSWLTAKKKLKIK